MAYAERERQRGTVVVVAEWGGVLIKLLKARGGSERSVNASWHWSPGRTQAAWGWVQFRLVTFYHVFWIQLHSKKTPLQRKFHDWGVFNRRHKAGYSQSQQEAQAEAESCTSHWVALPSTVDLKIPVCWGCFDERLSAMLSYACEASGWGSRGVGVALREVSTSPSFWYLCRPIAPLVIRQNTKFPSGPNHHIQLPSTKAHRRAKKRKKEKKIQTNLQLSMTDGKNNAKWEMNRSWST